MGHSHDQDRKRYLEAVQRMQDIRVEETRLGTPAHVIRALQRAERQAYAADLALVATTARGAF